MIARLTLGSAGPRLRGVPDRGAGRGTGRSTGRGRADGFRRTGTRWALVVVSKELYCESTAGEWSDITGAGSVLEARCGDRRYTASGALRGCVADAGLRGVLVPEEAVRGRRRLLRLARMRFRRPGRLLSVVAQIAFGALLVASIATLAVTSRAAIEASASLSRAEAMNAERVARTESLARLQDEAARLKVDGAGRPPALPGSLVSALVSSLAPGERIYSVAADGYDVTLVAEGGLELVSRIGSLERMETTGHTITERDGVSVVTVRVRQGEGEP